MPMHVAVPLVLSTLALLLSLAAVIYRQGRNSIVKELIQDIALDMIPPGKTEKFRVIAIVTCVGAEEQIVRLERDTTRRIV